MYSATDGPSRAEISESKQGRAKMSRSQLEQRSLMHLKNDTETVVEDDRTQTHLTRHDQLSPAARSDDEPA